MVWDREQEELEAFVCRELGVKLKLDSGPSLVLASV
jgi:hypothetical protein